MSRVLSIKNLNKNYGSFQAVKNLSLDFVKGEIFALLGPNGAGKTSLIGCICGIVRKTSGSISVCGYDVDSDYRKARAKVGVVPQELTTNVFERVWDVIRFSRGVYGLPADDEYLDSLLKTLSLYEKKYNKLMTLSGGMKRRVMIAKALAHKPEVLFLDEPTAGVDVELRKDMWKMVSDLKKMGVTIILTTHYIEEAEEMADRIGVILNGELIVVDSKESLMHQMGGKSLILDLTEKLEQIPSSLKNYNLLLDGNQIRYQFDLNSEDDCVANLLEALKHEGILFKDLKTEQRRLEDIFVSLVNERK